MPLSLQDEPKQATDTGFIVNTQDIGQARGLSRDQETLTIIRPGALHVGYISHLHKGASGMIEHPYDDWQAP